MINDTYTHNGGLLSLNIHFDDVESCGPGQNVESYKFFLYVAVLIRFCYLTSLEYEARLRVNGIGIVISPDDIWVRQVWDFEDISDKTYSEEETFSVIRACISSMRHIIGTFFNHDTIYDSLEKTNIVFTIENIYNNKYDFDKNRCIDVSDAYGLRNPVFDVKEVEKFTMSTLEGKEKILATVVNNTYMNGFNFNRPLSHFGAKNISNIGTNISPYYVVNRYVSPWTGDHLIDTQWLNSITTQRKNLYGSCNVASYLASCNFEEVTSQTSYIIATIKGMPVSPVGNIKTPYIDTDMTEFFHVQLPHIVNDTYKDNKLSFPTPNLKYVEEEFCAGVGRPIAAPFGFVLATSLFHLWDYYDKRIALDTDAYQPPIFSEDPPPSSGRTPTYPLNHLGNNGELHNYLVDIGFEEDRKLITEGKIQPYLTSVNAKSELTEKLIPRIISAPSSVYSAGHRSMFTLFKNITKAVYSFSENKVGSCPHDATFMIRTMNKEMPIAGFVIDYSQFDKRCSENLINACVNDILMSDNFGTYSSPDVCDTLGVYNHVRYYDINNVCNYSLLNGNRIGFKKSVKCSGEPLTSHRNGECNKINIRLAFMLSMLSNMKTPPYIRKDLWYIFTSGSAKIGREWKTYIETVRRIHGFIVKEVKCSIVGDDTVVNSFLLTLPDFKLYNSYQLGFFHKPNKSSILTNGLPGNFCSMRSFIDDIGIVRVVPVDPYKLCLGLCTIKKDLHLLCPLKIARSLQFAMVCVWCTEDPDCSNAIKELPKLAIQYAQKIFNEYVSQEEELDFSCLPAGYEDISGYIEHLTKDPDEVIKIIKDNINSKLISPELRLPYIEKRVCDDEACYYDNSTEHRVSDYEADRTRFSSVLRFLPITETRNTSEDIFINNQSKQTTSCACCFNNFHVRCKECPIDMPLCFSCAHVHYEDTKHHNYHRSNTNRLCDSCNCLDLGKIYFKVNFHCETCSTEGQSIFSMFDRNDNTGTALLTDVIINFGYAWRDRFSSIFYQQIHMCLLYKETKYDLDSKASLHNWYVTSIDDERYVTLKAIIEGNKRTRPRFGTTTTYQVIRDKVYVGDTCIIEEGGKFLLHKYETTIVNVGDVLSMSVLTDVNNSLMSYVKQNPTIPEKVINYTLNTRIKEFLDVDDSNSINKFLSRNFCTLRGPAGSGKTTFIANTIMRLVDTNKTIKIRVLVPTHNAGLVLASKLTPIYSSAKLYLPPQAKVNLNNLPLPLWTTGPLPQVLIHCVQSSVAGECNYIFFDEASMIKDIYFIKWIGILNPTNVYFAGDPLQMEPIQYDCPSEVANFFCYSTYGIDGKEPDYQLKYQFRFQRSIGNFISETFVDGEVENHSSTKPGGIITLIEHNHSPKSTAGGSFSNDGEADLAYQIACEESDNIMILTPYQGHKTHMMVKYPTLVVKTVMDSQGSDSNIVIFCITNKNAKFLNKNLLHVASSRAKEKFIVLIQSGKCTKYIEDYLKCLQKHITTKPKSANQSIPYGISNLDTKHVLKFIGHILKPGEQVILPDNSALDHIFKYLFVNKINVNVAESNYVENDMIELEQPSFIAFSGDCIVDNVSIKQQTYLFLAAGKHSVKSEKPIHYTIVYCNKKSTINIDLSPIKAKNGFVTVGYTDVGPIYGLITNEDGRCNLVSPIGRIVNTTTEKIPKILHSLKMGISGLGYNTAESIMSDLSHITNRYNILHDICSSTGILSWCALNNGYKGEIICNDIVMFPIKHAKFSLCDCQHYFKSNTFNDKEIMIINPPFKREIHDRILSQVIETECDFYFISCYELKNLHLHGTYNADLFTHHTIYVYTNIAMELTATPQTGNAKIIFNNPRKNGKFFGETIPETYSDIYRSLCVDFEGVNSHMDTSVPAAIQMAFRSYNTSDEGKTIDIKPQFFTNDRTYTLKKVIWNAVTTQYQKDNWQNFNTTLPNALQTMVKHMYKYKIENKFLMYNCSLDRGFVSTICCRSSMVCNTTGCDNKANYLNLEKTAGFCYSCVEPSFINAKVLLNNPIFYDLYRVNKVQNTPDKKLVKLHSYYCQINHGEAHDPLSDVNYTLCAATYYLKQQIQYKIDNTFHQNIGLKVMRKMLFAYCEVMSKKYNRVINFGCGNFHIPGTTNIDIMSGGDYHAYTEDYDLGLFIFSWDIIGVDPENLNGAAFIIDRSDNPNIHNYRIGNINITTAGKSCYATKIIDKTNYPIAQISQALREKLHEIGMEAYFINKPTKISQQSNQLNGLIIKQPYITLLPTETDDIVDFYYNRDNKTGFGIDTESNRTVEKLRSCLSAITSIYPLKITHALVLGASHSNKDRPMSEFLLGMYELNVTSVDSVATTKKPHYRENVVVSLIQDWKNTTLYQFVMDDIHTTCPHALLARFDAAKNFVDMSYCYAMKITKSMTCVSGFWDMVEDTSKYYAATTIIKLTGFGSTSECFILFLHRGLEYEKLINTKSSIYTDRCINKEQFKQVYYKLNNLFINSMFLRDSESNARDLSISVFNSGRVTDTSCFEYRTLGYVMYQSSSMGSRDKAISNLASKGFSETNGIRKNFNNGPYLNPKDAPIYQPQELLNSEHVFEHPSKTFNNGMSFSCHTIQNPKQSQSNAEANDLKKECLKTFHASTCETNEPVPVYTPGYIDNGKNALNQKSHDTRKKGKSGGLFSPQTLLLTVAVICCLPSTMGWGIAKNEIITLNNTVKMTNINIPSRLDGVFIKHCDNNVMNHVHSGGCLHRATSPGKKFYINYDMFCRYNYLSPNTEPSKLFFLTLLTHTFFNYQCNGFTAVKRNKSADKPVPEVFTQDVYKIKTCLNFVSTKPWYRSIRNGQGLECVHTMTNRLGTQPILGAIDSNGDNVMLNCLVPGETLKRTSLTFTVPPTSVLTCDGFDTILSVKLTFDNNLYLDIPSMTQFTLATYVGYEMPSTISHFNIQPTLYTPISLSSPPSNSTRVLYYSSIGSDDFILTTTDPLAEIYPIFTDPICTPLSANGDLKPREYRILADSFEYYIQNCYNQNIYPSDENQLAYGIYHYLLEKYSYSTHCLYDDTKLSFNVASNTYPLIIKLPKCDGSLKITIENPVYGTKFNRTSVLDVFYIEHDFKIMSALTSLFKNITYINGSLDYEPVGLLHHAETNISEVIQSGNNTITMYTSKLAPPYLIYVGNTGTRHRRSVDVINCTSVSYDIVMCNYTQKTLLKGSFTKFHSVCSLGVCKDFTSIVHPTYERPWYVPMFLEDFYYGLTIKVEYEHVKYYFIAIYSGVIILALALFISISLMMKTMRNCYKYRARELQVRTLKYRQEADKLSPTDILNAKHGDGLAKKIDEIEKNVSHMLSLKLNDTHKKDVAQSNDPNTHTINVNANKQETVKTPVNKPVRRGLFSPVLGIFGIIFLCTVADCQVMTTSRFLIALGNCISYDSPDNPLVKLDVCIEKVEKVYLAHLPKVHFDARGRYDFSKSKDTLIRGIFSPCKMKTDYVKADFVDICDGNNERTTCSVVGSSTRADYVFSSDVYHVAMTYYNVMPPPYPRSGLMSYIGNEYHATITVRGLSTYQNRSLPIASTYKQISRKIEHGEYLTFNEGSLEYSLGFRSIGIITNHVHEQQTEVLYVPRTYSGVSRDLYVPQIRTNNQDDYLMWYSDSYRLSTPRCFERMWTPVRQFIINEPDLVNLDINSLGAVNPPSISIVNDQRYFAPYSSIYEGSPISIIDCPVSHDNDCILVKRHLTVLSDLYVVLNTDKQVNRFFNDKNATIKSVIPSTVPCTENFPTSTTHFTIESTLGFIHIKSSNQCYGVKVFYTSSTTSTYTINCPNNGRMDYNISYQFNGYDVKHSYQCSKQTDFDHSQENKIIQPDIIFNNDGSSSSGFFQNLFSGIGDFFSGIFNGWANFWHIFYIVIVCIVIAIVLAILSRFGVFSAISKTATWSLKSFKKHKPDLLNNVRKFDPEGYIKLAKEHAKEIKHNKPEEPINEVVSNTENIKEIYENPTPIRRRPPHFSHASHVAMVLFMLICVTSASKSHYDIKIHVHGNTNDLVLYNNTIYRGGSPLRSCTNYHTMSKYDVGGCMDVISNTPVFYEQVLPITDPILECIIAKLTPKLETLPMRTGTFRLLLKHTPTCSNLDNSIALGGYANTGLNTDTNLIFSNSTFNFYVPRPTFTAPIYFEATDYNGNRLYMDIGTDLIFDTFSYPLVKFSNINIRSHNGPFHIKVYSYKDTEQPNRFHYGFPIPGGSTTFTLDNTGIAHVSPMVYKNFPPFHSSTNSTYCYNNYYPCFGGLLYSGADKIYSLTYNQNAVAMFVPVSDNRYTYMRPSHCYSLNQYGVEHPISIFHTNNHIIMHYKNCQPWDKKTQLNLGKQALGMLFMTSNEFSINYTMNCDGVWSSGEQSYSYPFIINHSCLERISLNISYSTYGLGVTRSYSTIHYSSEYILEGNNQEIKSTQHDLMPFSPSIRSHYHHTNTVFFNLTTFYVIYKSNFIPYLTFDYLKHQFITPIEVTVCEKLPGGYLKSCPLKITKPMSNFTLGYTEICSLGICYDICDYTSCPNNFFAIGDTKHHQMISHNMGENSLFHLLVIYILYLVSIVLTITTVLTAYSFPSNISKTCKHYTRFRAYIENKISNSSIITKHLPSLQKFVANNSNSNIISNSDVLHRIKVMDSDMALRKTNRKINPDPRPAYKGSVHHVIMVLYFFLPLITGQYNTHISDDTKCKSFIVKPGVYSIQLCSLKSTYQYSFVSNSHLYEPTISYYHDRSCGDSSLYEHDDYLCNNCRLFGNNTCDSCANGKVKCPVISTYTPFFYPNEKCGCPISFKNHIRKTAIVSSNIITSQSPPMIGFLTERRVLRHLSIKSYRILDSLLDTSPMSLITTDGIPTKLDNVIPGNYIDSITTSPNTYLLPSKVSVFAPVQYGDIKPGYYIPKNDEVLSMDIFQFQSDGVPTSKTCFENMHIPSDYKFFKAGCSTNTSYPSYSLSKILNDINYFNYYNLASKTNDYTKCSMNGAKSCLEFSFDMINNHDYSVDVTIPSNMPYNIHGLRLNQHGSVRNVHSSVVCGLFGTFNGYNIIFESNITSNKISYSENCYGPKSIFSIDTFTSFSVHCHTHDKPSSVNIGGVLHTLTESCIPISSYIYSNFIDIMDFSIDSDIIHSNDDHILYRVMKGYSVMHSHVGFNSHIVLLIEIITWSILIIIIITKLILHIYYHHKYPYLTNSNRGVNSIKQSPNRKHIEAYISEHEPVLYSDIKSSLCDKNDKTK